MVVVPRDDSPAQYFIVIPGSGGIDDISIWNMIGIPTRCHKHF